jgi:hypothetical protein
MKIIDQTPFVDDKGEISLFNRAKATLQFGPSWYGEVQAQTQVIAFLERGLDRGYTLLRNFTLPGTQATIPMILVGPPGIYVLYVTNLGGVYRAKGDEWAVIENNTVKLAPVNLLTRTARMARAVQVFLERQGYVLSTAVEGVLLGVNPSLHVESTRPMVRVVLSDALDRFVVSVSQARVVMGSEAALDIVNHLQHPSQAKKLVATPEPEPVVPTVSTLEARQEEPSQVETFSEDLGFAFEDSSDGQAEAPTFSESPLASVMEGTEPGPYFGTESTQPPKRTSFSGKQWALLIAFGAIEIIILIVFGVLALSDFL